MKAEDLVQVTERLGGFEPGLFLTFSLFVPFRLMFISFALHVFFS